MVSKQYAKILLKLRENGSIAMSGLSKAILGYLRPLLESGVLAEKRRGRGLIITVGNTEAFEVFIDKHFPNGLEEVQPDAVTRSEAISYWRESKHGDLDSEVVFIRAAAGQILTRNSDILRIGQMTEIAGVASFILYDTNNNHWQFNNSIALVENYEVFLHWQQIGVSADVAIWTAGRMSQRMINWLMSEQMQQCRIFHCGDYDPVGLDEFYRIYKHLGNRVNLYIPTNIEDLFYRYSNPALLQRKSSAKILERLRSNRHPDIIKIIEFIDTCNGGLEQEILLKY
jgi:hypothetical protein